MVRLDTAARGLGDLPGSAYKMDRGDTHVDAWGIRDIRYPPVYTINASPQEAAGDTE